MKDPTITITVSEGTIVYVPGRRIRTNRHEMTEGSWRLLPAKGKGTRPLPHRLRRFVEGRPHGKA
jgi:hypothetical protein